MQSVNVNSGEQLIAGPLPSMGNIDVPEVELKKAAIKVKKSNQSVLDRTFTDVSIEVAGDDWAYCKSDN